MHAAHHCLLCRVWSLGSGECLHELTGHTARVTQVQVASQGQTAISVADDYTARVWNWSSGQCLCALADSFSLSAQQWLFHCLSRAAMMSALRPEHRVAELQTQRCDSASQSAAASRSALC